MSLATITTKDIAVVKVCCAWFRDDILSVLEKQYGEEFVLKNIRFTIASSNSIAAPRPSSGDE